MVTHTFGSSFRSTRRLFIIESYQQKIRRRVKFDLRFEANSEITREASNIISMNLNYDLECTVHLGYVIVK